VGFGSYTYNNAEGGPFGITVMEDTMTLGGAVLRPFHIGGELGVGFTWANPIDGVPLLVIPQADPGENQYGVELYWKVLVTKDLYFTPSVQYIRNPTFNADTNDLWVPGLKFRLFL
ncbi:MAG: carbohydrate porin, partial [Gammaproteobacteria bacterium]